MKAFLFAIALVGCSPGAASAQLPDSTQAAIDHYRVLIRSAESAQSRRSLEPILAALRSVEQALLQSQGDRSSVLESLSPERYQRVQDELVGVLVNRDESLFVDPDPNFFAKLAAAHGEAADQAFFAAYKTIYPQGVWPDYIEMQTDYSGCTRFGSMKLVEAYGMWTDFQRWFPGRYRIAVGDELADVIGELESTCACGDKAGVERELQAFVRRFPSSLERPALEKRLQDLRNGRSKIRVRCISG